MMTMRMRRKKRRKSNVVFSNEFGRPFIFTFMAVLCIFFNNKHVFAQNQTFPVSVSPLGFDGRLYSEIKNRNLPLRGLN